MRDRLIELIKDAEKAFPKDKPVLDIEEFVADHLLANGVIVPPCKVGQTVFFITYVCNKNGKPLYYITEGKITSFSFDESGVWFYTVHGDGLRHWHKNDSIGINVFFTREEADKVLAERRGEE